MKKNLVIIAGILLILSAAFAQAERLPVIGNDANQWGNLLNSYLLVAHDENGTLKDTFQLSNFTDAYDGRTDRFENANFTSDLASKSTTDLAEGANLYYTNARARLVVEGYLPALWNLANDTTNFNTLLAAASVNTNQVTGLGAFALLNEIPEDNITQGKIHDLAVTDAKISDVAAGKVTGLSSFIYVTERNPSNATIQINSNQIVGLGTLGNKSTINNADWSGTQLAVANGGTGATTASNARTNLGLVISTDVQAYDADLTTYAGITPSANIQTLLGSADFAAARTNLGLVIGTDVQAFDADLSDLADGSLTGTKVSPDFGSQNIVTTGTLTVGTSGTAITKHLSATAALDFSDVGATACSADLTITVTGAAVGDTVALGAPVAADTATAVYSAFVSAANTVTVRRCQMSNDGNPASGTFRVDVWQH